MSFLHNTAAHSRHNIITIYHHHHQQQQQQQQHTVEVTDGRSSPPCYSLCGMAQHTHLSTLDPLAPVPSALEWPLCCWSGGQECVPPPTPPPAPPAAAAAVMAAHTTSVFPPNLPGQNASFQWLWTSSLSRAACVSQRQPNPGSRHSCLPLTLPSSSPHPPLTLTLPSSSHHPPITLPSSCLPACLPASPQGRASTQRHKHSLKHPGNSVLLLSRGGSFIRFPISFFP